MKHPLPTLLMMLALALIPSAPILAADTKAITPTDMSEVDSLEEIVVTGDRTLSAAREAIVEAEDRFYARWNELNSDRRFDIRCAMEARTGTRFVFRVCRPAFVEDSEQADAAAFLNTTSGTPMMNSGAPARTILMGELRKRTLEQLRKDPELLRALVERARLQQHYEELRKEKFKDRWIVWD